MADLRRHSAELEPSKLMMRIVRLTSYEDYLKGVFPGDSASRVENLQELVNALSAYDGMEGGVQAFLDRTALLSEVENVQGTMGVRLMTLHAAKGLEFPLVFIVGAEENLCPHARSSEEYDDVEEERRLFHVGMTRAQTRLFLTRAMERFQFGQGSRAEPSRFLGEIPPHLIRESLDDTGHIARRAAARAGRRPGDGDPRQRLRHWADVGDTRWQEETPAGPYTLGCKVHHPEYGVGTVIGIVGSGEKQKVTVSFTVYGSKKFLPHHAPLEKI